jgi:hypothetical protein
MVLAKVAAVDNRRLDAPDAMDTPILDSWHEVIGDLRFQDCIEAVKVHRRQSTDWLQVGHIRALVKQIRDDRIDRTEMPIPNVDPDDPAAGIDEIRALRKAIGDGTFDADAYAKGDITLSGHPARHALGGPEVSKQRGLEVAAQRVLRAIPPPSRDEEIRSRPMPSPTVDATRAADQEAARSRQLAALVARYGPAVAAGAPPPPGPDGTR